MAESKYTLLAICTYEKAQILKTILEGEGVMVLIVTHDMTLVELVQENAQIITNKEFIQSN